LVDRHTISVIIMTHDRRGSVAEVCAAWMKQPVDQVWLVDGGDPKVLPSYSNAGNTALYAMATDSRFEYWPLWKDHGTRTDYALALLTDGDFIILADDDVLPEPGFAKDLHDGFHAAGGDIVGIMGRQFNGPRYYEDTRYFRADAVTQPLQVGFVGVVYFASRALFGFDTRGMGRNVDDLWWQMRERPDARKWVVPSKSYRDLPCSMRGMFHDNGRLRKQREIFYRECYEKHYAPKGLQW
jgi:hypothetical protein